MKFSATIPLILFLSISCFMLLATAKEAKAIEPIEVFSVWPDKPPGNPKEKGPEKLVEGRPRPFYQITDITRPTVSVYLPPKEKRTGAAVLVLPGGGLQRLAIEHEGLEVAEWLNAQNISVFVLKYRVPERAQIALQDVQRALSLLRSRSEDWGIDPEDIGVVGFSAGAELAAWLATHHKERQYEAIDAADAFSCRPAFATLIYPGGLTQGMEWKLKDAIASHLNQETPPMFIAQANDDSSENSLAMMLALKRAHVPAELHVYQEGGHGFGVRASGSPVGAWSMRWREWLEWQGFLDSAPVRQFAREIIQTVQSNGVSPRFSRSFPSATMVDALAVQKRFVRRHIQSSDPILGFLEQPARAAAEPTVTGVIFHSQKIKPSDNNPIEIPKVGRQRLVLGLAYSISVDLSTRIPTATQAQGAFATVAPVVAILPDAEDGNPVDRIAANPGTGRYLMGGSKPMTGKTEDQAESILLREGQKLKASPLPSGGKWSALWQCLNLLSNEGYTLHAGEWVICPLPGTHEPAQPGHYEADFGTLGRLSFELQ